jgi:hypothetical protein
MRTRTRFRKEDIGGEILPILTTGLYRNTLDALREYIQNSIDAKTSEIELIIDPTAVTVSDSGDGMSPDEAQRAIRLGISDKSPIENVGFRGIGIYSAFNLCNSAEVFTKKAGTRGSRIIFNFGDIRRELLKEQERRKRGLPPRLYLEKLLSSSVAVEADDEEVIPDHGTRLILSDLLPECYRQIQDWGSVESYLQNVVPLPFSSDFRYGNTLQKKLEKEGYRFIPLTLQIGSRLQQIFRPYVDDIFARDEQFPPEYFPITKGKERYGFAWVCVNGRRVIKNQYAALRGLLLRKFDFSIGTRSYLEPYFKRPVFHRRITGEVIIQSQSVLPNAARSDLENNSARQGFLEALAAFVHSLEKWADNIQEESKSVEVLADVKAELEELSGELPRTQHDKEAMLRAHVRIAEYSDKLKTHRPRLRKHPEKLAELSATEELLDTCKALVSDALKTSRTALKNVERDVVRVVQAERKSKEHPRERLDDAPTDLVSVMQNCGIDVPADIQRAIRLFEDDLLLDQIKRPTYTALLSQLMEMLEEDS